MTKKTKAKPETLVYDDNPILEAGTALGVLVARKSDAYGDSVAKSGAILAILYPQGIPADPAALRDLALTVRVLDKLARIAHAAGRSDPMAENPWHDVAGYGLRGSMLE